MEILKFFLSLLLWFLFACVIGAGWKIGQEYGPEAIEHLRKKTKKQPTEG